MSIVFLSAMVAFYTQSFTNETILIRVTEVKTGCTNAEPGIRIVMPTGKVEQIALEKSDKFASTTIMGKVKEQLNRFLKAGYEIYSSTSNLVEHQQDCYYNMDYVLMKQ